MICRVEYHGTMPYAEATRLQRERVLDRQARAIPDTLILVEHPPVYTLGRNAKTEHLLAPREWLAKMGAEVFETDRGGDVTFHGPGQLVGYPILDLTGHRRDIAWYMRSIEEVLIGAVSDFSISAGRIAGVTGVWVGQEKLAALGVHVSRWVTSHGFALNVSTDLRYFSWIVPCGLRDKGVTSLEKLLSRRMEINDVTSRVVEWFGRVFHFEIEERATCRREIA